jgi:hypothetical protein
MRRTRWRIRVTVLLVAVLAGLGAIGLRPAWAIPPQHAQRHLTVATYNLYLGADLTPLFAASSPQELVQRAGQIYANVVKTDFPSRAEAIAGLLAANPPMSPACRRSRCGRPARLADRSAQATTFWSCCSLPWPVTGSPIGRWPSTSTSPATRLRSAPPPQRVSPTGT